MKLIHKTADYYAVVCLLLLLATSCTVSRSDDSKNIIETKVPSPTIMNSSGNTKASDSIEKKVGQVSEFFLNFTYPWVPKDQKEYFNDMRTVTFLNGKLIHSESNNDKLNDLFSSFDVRLEQYEIDVNQDGIEEIIINLSIGLPDRSYPSCIFVFSKNSKSKDKPQLIWQYESGKFDVKGFKNYYSNNIGQLIIEEYDISESPLCCPSAFYRSIFQWSNKTFNLISNSKIPNVGNSRNE